MPKPPLIESESRRNLVLAVLMVALLALSMGLAALLTHSRRQNASGLSVDMPATWSQLPQAWGSPALSSIMTFGYSTKTPQHLVIARFRDNVVHNLDQAAQVGKLMLLRQGVPIRIDTGPPIVTRAGLKMLRMSSVVIGSLQQSIGVVHEVAVLSDGQSYWLIMLEAAGEVRFNGTLEVTAPAGGLFDRVCDSATPDGSMAPAPTAPADGTDPADHPPLGDPV